MKYDVCYSITAHENIDCVLDLYENIVKFNAPKKCFVIVHCNKHIYEQSQMKGPFHDKHIVFNSNWTEKEKFNSDIFLAHIDNFWMASRWQFDYFSLLASNCLFVRPVDWDAIKQSPPLKITQTGYKVESNDRHMVEEFKKNPRLVEIFHYNNIGLTIKTHEGAYFQKEVFDSIFHFCKRWGIDKKAFEHDTFAAEELILPSLEKCFTGVVSKRYAGWIPNITEKDVLSIIETGTCPSFTEKHYTIVKGIARDMNDKMRCQIRQLTQDKLPAK